MCIRDRHHKAPLPGLWQPEVAIWDQIIEGDLLGTLRDLYGDTRAEIRASCNGTLIGMPRMQYVHEGMPCGIIL